MMINCLEEVIITFLVTVEYCEIKYTPQQLSQMSHLSASREVLNTILRIDEDTLLISQSQQQELKLSNYENVSKLLLQSESWKEVMINSPILNEIIKNHISDEILEMIDK
jgi:hypothetical protein